MPTKIRLTISSNSMIIIAAVSFLPLTNANLFGQGGSLSTFSEFTTSRFAKAIGLGNAYTGVAEGIEATYYNTAGLASIECFSAVYSNGDGFAYFINDDIKLGIFDVAFVSPLPSKLGTMAFSYNVFSLTGESGNSRDAIYRIHFARHVLKKLSAGFSVDYYRAKASFFGDTDTGTAWDFSLSTLLRLPNIFLPSSNDELRFGAQLQNLADSKDEGNRGISKHQIFRLGTSYSLLPSRSKIHDLSVLKILIAFDAVFLGSNYDFDLWQPNFGIQLALLEYLQFRFGRENEREIDDVYLSSPQHPVSRYGFGLELPIDKLLDYNKDLSFRIDYSLSNWTKIDESRGNFDTDAFTIQLKMKM